MSTHFVGEGNIGSAPRHKSRIPQRQRRATQVACLNVASTTRSRRSDGEYEDRGGFGAPVELWHRDAGHWQSRFVPEGHARTGRRTHRARQMGGRRRERGGLPSKIEARRVGILPYRIEAVRLSSKPTGASDQA